MPPARSGHRGSTRPLSMLNAQYLQPEPEVAASARVGGEDVPGRLAHLPGAGRRRPVGHPGRPGQVHGGCAGKGRRQPHARAEPVDVDPVLEARTESSDLARRAGLHFATLDRHPRQARTRPIDTCRPGIERRIGRLSPCVQVARAPGEQLTGAGQHRSTPSATRRCPPPRHPRRPTHLAMRGRARPPGTAEPARAR